MGVKVGRRMPSTDGGPNADEFKLVLRAVGVVLGLFVPDEADAEEEPVLCDVMIPNGGFSASEV